LKNTKLIIFIFKLFPFIYSNIKLNIFNNLENYYNQLEEPYIKFIRYYKKNWLKNTFINFVDLSNQEYFSRTNNYIERFHKSLYDALECIHPKISDLIERYKEYLINLYNKISASFINRIDAEPEKFSIIKDIKNFILKYNNKYKSELTFNNILQSELDLQNIIKNVYDYILDFIYDNNPNNINDAVEEENYIKDGLENSDEINQIDENIL